MKKTHFSGDKKLLSYNPGWTERPDPPSSAPRKDVWGGWKIILSLSLEMKGGRRETVETGIQRARGVVVKYRRAEGNGEEEEDLGKVEGADVSVTRYRHGPAYLEALAASKTIGTASPLPYPYQVHHGLLYSQNHVHKLHWRVPRIPQETHHRHGCRVHREHVFY